jgi:copper resistance protein B
MLADLVLLAMSPAASAQEHVEMEGMQDMEGMEWGPTAFGLAEVLEYAPLGEQRPIRYDLHSWVGGARSRVWAKADGEQSTREVAGDAGLQLLYGRMISPWWDVQVGVRLDTRYGLEEIAARPLLALGLQGLAPGWFELEPTLFVSPRGELSAELTASYDLLLTQRLVAQPRLETGVAVQEVADWGVGAGLGALELGLRVRYELWRELAPYVGLSWGQRFAGTARLAEAAGEPISEVSLVAGLRLWR